MKYWQIIIIFLIGAVITIIGALFKIMHWPYTSLMLIIGIGIKVISIMILIVKLALEGKTNELLNK